MNTRTLAVVLALVSLWGCDRRTEPPNIVLITVDTLRADHTSAYGYHLPTTPFLERLVADGVRIENAYAPMPTTLPSHTSMFTSMYPIAHGAIRNGMIVREELELLPEVLQRNGYRTATFVSSFPLNYVFGLGRVLST